MFQTGDIIHYRDARNDFKVGFFICSYATCPVEELIQIYFNKEISMRSFAFEHNICVKIRRKWDGKYADKVGMENMHIFRVAIEIYKFLSQNEENDFFVEDNTMNKEWILSIIFKLYHILYQKIGQKKC